MKLTKEASEALERLRIVDTGKCDQSQKEIAAWMSTQGDQQIVAWEMLRLFPPGHDAEITPESLSACGYTAEIEEEYFSNDAVYVNCKPQTMGEVWHLMERCGLEVKHEQE